MIYQTLPPFNPLSLGTKATLAVPRWMMTLARVVLSFPTGSAITKATISEIVVKVGARVVFGPISGAALDKINKFKGIYDDAYHLSIDFTERDGLTVGAKEIGGYDIPALEGDDIFVEVTNSAGAGTVNLSAYGGFTALQFNPKQPNNRRSQLVHKLLSYVIPSNGGTRVTWTPNFRGAEVKRIHFAYTGTDWTATADGNLKQVEVKKNGVAVWDRIPCNINRFIQQEHQKVPQAKTYALDFVHDNVHSATLKTRDARSLEFNIDLTANDTITAFVECLDLPDNL